MIVLELQGEVLMTIGEEIEVRVFPRLPITQEGTE